MGNFEIAELTRLYEEYKSFFLDIKLKSTDQKAHTHNNNNKSDRAPSRYISIRTVEGQNLDVSVCDSGWCILDGNQCLLRPYYETFESLMMTLSPSFQDSFHSELSLKLEQISTNLSGDEH
ncbi:uncharacterized protein PRCAT00001603001 [Priceomyces carsonii]|uniref:uncharacterized protein n=1 Tax=Priceomyces carsonii TaxID=28549 RepID=UPI002EDBB387|nr:unnamed protein product [Priceomyces carsonii]